MRIIKTIINTIISILLLILIIVTMFIICTKTLISKENISNFISDSDILNIDINLLFNKEESGITLKQKITDLAVETGIPNKIINDILKTKEINNLLGDFFNQTIIYIINDTDKPKILDETIEDMKQIARISLEKHLNIMLEPEQLDLYIEQYCNNITDIVPDRNEIIKDSSLNLAQNITNFNLVYLYTIIILLLLLISVINHCWYKFIKYLGITMLISGVLFVIIGSMDYIINNLIINEVKGLKPFITPLITNILTIFFKGGVLVSFSSIFLILTYLTINRISINNKTI